MRLFWTLSVKDQFKLALRHPVCTTIGVLIGFIIAMFLVISNDLVFNIK